MTVKYWKKKIDKYIAVLPAYAKEDAALQIEALKKAATLSEITNVRPMEGTDEPFFRLKFGDYRMMMYYYQDTETVRILSISHRKDTYKKHNLPWRK